MPADTSQRTGIISPAEGLQVYDTTTKTIWNYNGTVWINSVSNVYLVHKYLSETVMVKLQQ
jgi:hypothetical protein